MGKKLHVHVHRGSVQDNVFGAASINGLHSMLGAYHKVISDTYKDAGGYGGIDGQSHRMAADTHNLIAGVHSELARRANSDGHSALEGFHSKMIDLHRNMASEHGAIGHDLD